MTPNHNEVDEFTIYTNQMSANNAGFTFPWTLNRYNKYFYYNKYRRNRPMFVYPMIVYQTLHGGSVDIDQPVGEGYYGDTAMNHGHDVTP